MRERGEKVIAIFLTIACAFLLFTVDFFFNREDPAESGYIQNITVLDCPVVIPVQTIEPEEESYLSTDWDAEESYMLAKIAMAEAEGECIDCKALVICTVLNRVWSDSFPDSIEEVIFQERNGVYQFSPVGNGRYEKVEPNEECYEALRMVQEEHWDESMGATYFEVTTDNPTWHSRNLQKLFEHCKTSFYKEYE